LQLPPGVADAASEADFAIREVFPSLAANAVGAMSSVPRFFVPPDALNGDTVTLPAEAARHALRVLRLRAGERLTLHDGLGFAYHAVLVEGNGITATARIESKEPTRTEPRLRITIAQALPKTPDKIDQVLQHGTEVGAAGFVFWSAERSVARLADGEKIERRLARWHAITLAAAEQSGRGVVPAVRWANNRRELIESLGAYDTALALHEAASLPLRVMLDILPPQSNSILLIVGPEGSLSDAEISAFSDAGCQAVGLGPRILRTETAALVAVAQTLYHRGEN
jgi:16S rRNA (uracil1498-N3)-methyltransferase